MSPTYLEHHGILGQKWGIRRYQNPDGSLTPAGKKRYLGPGGALNEKGKKRLDENSHNAYLNKKSAEQDSRTNAKDGKASSIFTKGELSSVGKKDEDPELTELMFMELVEHNGESLFGKEHEEEYSKELEKFRKDPYNYSLPKNAINTMESTDFLPRPNPYSDNFSEREKEAADLGIEALRKMRLGPIGSETKIDDDLRGWFLTEDNTIGLGTIADLCRQGKSKVQIKALAEEASKASDEKQYANGYFELAEYSGTKYLDEYIDACQAVIKEEKSSRSSGHLSTKDMLSPEIAGRNIGYALKDALSPEAWKQGKEAYEKFMKNPDGAIEMPDYLKKYYKR